MNQGDYGVRCMTVFFRKNFSLWRRIVGEVIQFDPCFVSLRMEWFGVSLSNFNDIIYTPIGLEPVTPLDIVHAAWLDVVEAADDVYCADDAADSQPYRWCWPRWKTPRFGRPCTDTTQVRLGKATWRNELKTSCGYRGWNSIGGVSWFRINAACDPAAFAIHDVIKSRQRKPLAVDP